MSQCTAHSLCRRSRDRSDPPRGGRCRRSSRRTGSRRSGGRCRGWSRSRSRRGRRAPGSVSSVASRYSCPRSARASTTRPARNSSSIPATSTPRGLDGIVKRMRPSAESSTGPVKTSPDGMLRLPSELTHVRPATLSRRSVPSASMRSSRAPAQPLDQARLQRAQLAPGGRRVVAVEEHGAADERLQLGGPHPGLLGGGGRGPQGPAPAAPHRRLADRRAGPRGARHARGVDAGERGRVVGRLDRERRVGRPPPRPARRARTRRGARRAPRAHQSSSWRGSEVRSSGQAPRASSSRWSASSSGAASVVERTTTCWPGCTSRQ